MAGIKDIITIFKTVGAAFDQLNDVRYDKAYNINGAATQQTPFIMIDSMPDFNTVDVNAGADYKATKKQYKLKIFLYDDYYIAEQKVKPLEEKQQEMQIIFEQYLGEVQRYLLDSSTPYSMVGTSNDGFFGVKDYSNKTFVQMSQSITINAPLSCATGTFNY